MAFPKLTRPAAAISASAPATPARAAEPVKSLVLGSRFPKIPRPQMAKPLVTFRPPLKPLGYVVAPHAPAPVEPAPKPVEAPPAPRQTAGIGRVAPVAPGARAKPPEPPRQYREHFDRHGNRSIHPDDIPW
jgi:hypothetical protein